MIIRWPVWLLVPVLAALGGYWLGARSLPDAVPAAADSPPIPDASESQSTVAVPSPPPAPAPKPETRMMATAAGAVRRPGAYRLEADSRIQDLIDAAGGATADADLSDINIAAHVIDGSVLTLPALPAAGSSSPPQMAARLNPRSYTRSGWTPQSGAGTGSLDGTATSDLIDLNTASQSLLETLPGVGPVTATKIIEYRTLTPFRRVEDLTNIHGIGEKTLESLRPLVTVQ